MLDEVLITVAPKPLTDSSSSSSISEAAAAGGVATAGASSSTTTQLLQQQLGDDAEGLGLLGQVGVLDGIRLIEGALEAQLQRLSLAATNITIRLEVPRAAAAASASQQTAAAAAAPRAAAVEAAAGAELILHVEALHFYDATAQQQQQQQQPAAQPAAAAAAAGQQVTAPAAAAELVKCVSVTGLTLELLDLQEEDEGAECEQGSGLAASQLLDPASFVSSSSTTFQQQQSPSQQSPRQQSGYVRWSQQRSARGSCSSKYMTRSSMMRSSWMAEPAAAAAAEHVESWQQQQQQQCLDGLLLGGSGSSAGLDFKVELRLAQPAAAAAAATSGSTSTAAAAAATSAAGPRITADINSSPVSIVLQPWQLPLLELLSAAAAAAAAAASAPAATAAAAVPPSSAAAAAAAGRQQGSPTQQQQQQEWGTRSLVEDLFFPRCEGLVTSYLSFGGSNGSNVTGLSSSRAWQKQQQDQVFGGSNLLGSGLLGSVGSGLYNSVTTGDSNSDGLHSDMYSSMYNSSSSVQVGSVYHDARSVFVGNSSSSSMLGQSVQNYNTSGSAGSSLPVLQQLPQAPNPWASQQQQQQQQQQPLQRQQQEQRVAPAAAVWSVRGCIAAVTVALHYDVPTCAAAAAAVISSPKRQQQQQQQDQQPPRFVVQCSGLVASLDLAGKGRHITLKCYCLEASEHLLVAWGSAHCQLAQLTPGVLGAVPKAVPAVQGTTSGFVHQVGESASADACYRGCCVS
jgi:hypothetical protein